MEDHSKDIDSILKEHMKESISSEKLSANFNSRLMEKIDGLESSSYKPLVFNKGSLYIPIVLLFSFTILSFAYLFGQMRFESFVIDEILQNSSFLESKGLKYSIYSLSALFIFSIIDQISQYQKQNFSK